MRGRRFGSNALASLGMVAPLVALLAFLLLSSLYVFGARDLYWATVEHWGVVPFSFGVIFGDMHGLLAAWQCHHLGVDVIEADPCDIVHRSFNYSPLWMLASPLRLDVGSTNAAGWLCALLFLLCLFLLPPPRQARDLPIIVLATFSTMVAFAVERGNPDIVIFMLVLLAGYLALRSSWTRFLAYLIALAVGLLKYYPITLLVLTFRERVSTFLAVNLAALFCILMFAAVYLSELERSIPLIPSDIYFGDMFAAKNLPFGIVQTAFAGSDPSSSVSGRSVAFVLYVRFFFAGQNASSRGIFLLLVLPGLLAVARIAAGESTRAAAKVTSVLVVLLMWGEFFRTNLLFALRSFDAGEDVIQTAWFGFWLARELAWWWTISVLAAAALYLLSQSEIGRWFSS